MAFNQIRVKKYEYKQRFRSCLSKSKRDTNYNRYMHLHQMLKVGGEIVEE